jgi:hypothetical protein
VIIVEFHLFHSIPFDSIPDDAKMKILLPACPRIFRDNIVVYDQRREINAIPFNRLFGCPGFIYFSALDLEINLA